MAAIGRDITEAKRAQAALADANASLVEALRAKSEFMANMNHELRTPLNGVLGVSSLLADTHLDDEQREYVEALRVSGESLMAVIEDILDFSKLEAGKLALEREPVELRALVEEVCSIVAVSQPAPRGRGDRGGPGRHAGRGVGRPQAPAAGAHQPHPQRRQVHRGRRGARRRHLGRRRAATRSNCASRSSTPASASIRQQQQTIFESFSQADGSTTRRYGGTGLGLTIAQQLVTLMGGEIGVHSTPGAGSTFWFTLPTAHRDPRHPAAPPGGAPRACAR